MPIQEPHAKGVKTLGFQNDQLVFWFDSSRKKATCAVCNASIPGGTERLNIRFYLSSVRRYTKGYLHRMKVRVHISCMTEFLRTDEAYVPWRSCVGCGCRIENVKGYSPRGALCEDCQGSERWVACVACGWWYESYRMSVAAETYCGSMSPMLNMGDRVCERCTVNYDITTTKHLRAFRKLDDEYERLKLKIIERQIDNG